MSNPSTALRQSLIAFLEGLLTMPDDQRVLLIEVFVAELRGEPSPLARAVGILEGDSTEEPPKVN